MAIDQHLVGDLHRIFDTLPSGILIYDRHDRVIQINSKARTLLGLEDNRSFQSLKDLPEYLVEFRLMLSKSVEDIPRSEICLDLPLRKDISTLGFTLKQIDLSETDPIRIIVFNDITHILQDRLLMDKIRDELYQSKKLASIGTMISGVAHELNNPLTGISMNTQLIQMNLQALHQTFLAANTQEYAAIIENLLEDLEKIGREAKRASVLVSDLLNYSKPTKLNLTLIGITQLVQDVIQALKSHPAFTQLQFTHQTLDRDVEILCDRVKIEQVFYNLFKNAGEAMNGTGVVDIAYELKNHPVTQKPMVSVHVADKGPGIDKTVLGRVFDPFFTTKGAQGVGLGLSISYRTVEQHGGMLGVESNAGLGTVFHVQLPEYEEDDILI